MHAAAVDPTAQTTSACRQAQGCSALQHRTSAALQGDSTAEGSRPLLPLCLEKTVSSPRAAGILRPAFASEPTAWRKSLAGMAGWGKGTAQYRT